MLLKFADEIKRVFAKPTSILGRSCTCLIEIGLDVSYSDLASLQICVQVYTIVSRGPLSWLSG